MTTTHTYLLPVLVSVLCATTAFATPVTRESADTSSATTTTADSDENTRAQALYRQALAVFKEQKYEESRKLLLQLWTFRQTADVASALAKTELKLQLYREGPGIAKAVILPAHAAETRVS
jgi:hypothetical protein